MKIISRISVVAYFFLGVFSFSNANAEDSSISSCELMDEVGAIHNALPLCLKPPISSENAVTLFRWVFDNDFENLELDESLKFLESIKKHLKNVDYLYLKGLVFASYQQADKSMDLYKKAADIGHPEAAYDVYLALRFKSVNEAMKYLKQSAEGGYSIAQYSLGIMLLNGDGIEKDVKKSIEYIEASAYQGYGSAISKLLDLKLYLNETDQLFWELVSELGKGNYEKDQTFMNKIKDNQKLCKKLENYSMLFYDINNTSDVSKQTFNVLKTLVYSCLKN